MGFKPNFDFFLVFISQTRFVLIDLSKVPVKIKDKVKFRKGKVVGRRVLGAKLIESQQLGNLSLIPPYSKHL